MNIIIMMTIISSRAITRTSDWLWWLSIRKRKRGTA